MPEDS